MLTTRQATKRAARVRAIVLRRPRLRTCQAFYANTAADQKVDKCGRIATAHQSYSAVAGGPELRTYRCGTHRIPLDSPGLLTTATSLSGFAVQELIR